ncbi:RNA-binding protein, partial [Streptomyces sp. SID8455]|nr:RNA-binding protein [Streptomyces sp. SID8455]
MTDGARPAGSTGAEGPGGGEAADEESLDRPLPEPVRHRVVALASEGFGSLTPSELPAPLRQYARFTPSRRIKFAGNALAAALEHEPLFRQRVGERLRENQAELAAALDAGAPPPAADPLD